MVEIRMVPFAEAVKKITFPGFAGFKNDMAVFGDIVVKNPKKEIIRAALDEHVLRNSFKPGGVATVASDSLSGMPPEAAAEKAYVQMTPERQAAIRTAVKELLNIKTYFRNEMCKITPKMTPERQAAFQAAMQALRDMASRDNQTVLAKVIQNMPPEQRQAAIEAILKDIKIECHCN